MNEMISLTEEDWSLDRHFSLKIHRSADDWCSLRDRFRRRPRRLSVVSLKEKRRESEEWFEWIRRDLTWERSIVHICRLSLLNLCLCHFLRSEIDRLLRFRCGQCRLFLFEQFLRLLLSLKFLGVFLVSIVLGMKKSIISNLVEQRRWTDFSLLFLLNLFIVVFPIFIF